MFNATKEQLRDNIKNCHRNMKKEGVCYLCKESRLPSVYKGITESFE